MKLRYPRVLPWLILLCVCGPACVGPPRRPGPDPGQGGEGGEGGEGGDEGTPGGSGGTVRPDAGRDAGKPDSSSAGSGGFGGTGGGGAGGDDTPDAGSDEPVGRKDGGKGDTGAKPDAQPTLTGCTLVWSPNAHDDGAAAFEGLEMPDSASIATHLGVKHFTTVAEHDAIRIDQHNSPGAVDYDRRQTDRIRCEVKGMKAGGKNLEMLNGQTWTISWSFNAPTSLKGSNRFVHIWQMKYVDTAGESSDLPILTLDLSTTSGSEKIQLDVNSVATLPGTAFSELHDKWLTGEVTIKIAPGTEGSVRWVLRDGDKVLADAKKTGIATWPSNAQYLRPKWGIYRSLEGDAVPTTYILLSDFRAYTCK